MNAEEALQAMRDTVAEWRQWPGDNAHDMMERMVSSFEQLDLELTSTSAPLPEEWNHPRQEFKDPQ